MFGTRFVGAALVMAASALQVQAEPLQKDERDVLRIAHVYHIMGASRDQLDRVRLQLDGVPERQLISTFSRIAQKASSDTGSAGQGGDLGFIAEGVMDGQFDAAVFAQKPMQVSRPEQSKFGWHLILITAMSEEPVRTICENSIKQVQKAVPIAPGLLEFSLTTSGPAALHPAVLKFLGQDWGAPLKMGEDLAYMRREADAPPGFRRVTIHTEFPYARYVTSPKACVRSERREFFARCKDKTVALASWAEYEGRAASGRALAEARYGESQRKFQIAESGLLSQVLVKACGSDPT